MLGSVGARPDTMTLGTWKWQSEIKVKSGVIYRVTYSLERGFAVVLPLSCSSNRKSKKALINSEFQSKCQGVRPDPV